MWKSVDSLSIQSFIESQQRNLRTRITRFVRRTLCFAKTARRHNLVRGFCLHRSVGVRPL